MSGEPTAILLHERRVVWHIVHKAASTAIIRAVLRMEGLPLERPYHGNPRLSWAQSEDAPTAGWTHAMVVRHPLERLASCYLYHVVQRRAASENLRALGAFPEMPFPAFVELVARDLGADVHFRPQAWQCRWPDMHGRVETIGQDWRTLQRHLPLPPLEVCNRTVAPGGDLYDDETRARARAIYRCDLDAFGYW